MRALVLLVVAVAAAPASAADWLQFGLDSSHSGINPQETTLTRATVAQLRLLYSATLPGTAEGAPVLLSGVSTPSGTQDVLYLTLSNGTLIALDAASGTLLWSRYPSDTHACATAAGACTTTSSPALDPNRQFVYNYALDGFVHKYTVGDGTEITGGGWPQLATAKPDVEAESAALAFATTRNGTTYLYATFVVSAQSRFVARNHQALDLAGAFVDLGDLRVAEIALERHFLGVAHAAVDLHSLVRDPHRRFRSGELRD